MGEDRKEKVLANDDQENSSGKKNPKRKRSPEMKRDREKGARKKRKLAKDG